MSRPHTSHRKRNSGKTQTPSKGDPPVVTNTPTTAVDTRRTLPGSTKGGTGYPTDPDVPEVTIVLMGVTGSGKSTFINLVSGSTLGIGEGLRSCTNAVQHGSAFDLDGRRVVLVDTPGFDDTTQSDTDILKMIAAFLETSYKRGTMLAGVLYFHRISDPRVGGIAAKNFTMFRKLCGGTALPNVVIVTNRWGEVDPRVGADREAELKNDDLFFKPVLDKGARMARHENTVPSAEDIIRLILGNEPRPLRIQVELVDKGINISETSAGKELNREINAQIKKHQEEMRALKEEMEQVMRDKDEQAKREIEAQRKGVQREIKRLQNDSQRLAPDYKSEKETLEARLEQMEAERRQEADRLAPHYQRRTDKRRHTLEANTATSRRGRGQIDGSPRGGTHTRHSEGGFFTRIVTVTYWVVERLIPF